MDRKPSRRVVKTKVDNEGAGAGRWRIPRQDAGLTSPATTAVRSR